jgi:hypothetical protein
MSTGKVNELTSEGLRGYITVCSEIFDAQSDFAQITSLVSSYGTLREWFFKTYPKDKGAGTGYEWTNFPLLAYNHSGWDGAMLDHAIMYMNAVTQN